MDRFKKVFRKPKQHNRDNSDTSVSTMDSSNSSKRCLEKSATNVIPFLDISVENGKKLAVQYPEYYPESDDSDSTVSLLDMFPPVPNRQPWDERAYATKLGIQLPKSGYPRLKPKAGRAGSRNGSSSSVNLLPRQEDIYQTKHSNLSTKSLGTYLYRGPVVSRPNLTHQPSRDMVQISNQAMYIVPGKGDAQYEQWSPQTGMKPGRTRPRLCSSPVPSDVRREVSVFSSQEYYYARAVAAAATKPHPTSF
ncbi:hypothetical protein C8J56DRAFT_1161178 [Mycena floridula]|nr:hypothetical protein C8J56DRAFT_1161178 [Mycena floridula]